MNFDYYYGSECEQFAFYRIPKILFTDDAFTEISVEAKTLYGILLDRMQLSARNGWLDDRGRVYIVFTIEQIREAMGCGNKKAIKLLDELEKEAHLIERKRCGMGKPIRLVEIADFNSFGAEYRGATFVGVERQSLHQVKGGSLAQFIVVATINTGYITCRKRKGLGFAFEKQKQWKGEKNE